MERNEKTKHCNNWIILECFRWFEQLEFVSYEKFHTLPVSRSSFCWKLWQFPRLSLQTHQIFHPKVKRGNDWCRHLLPSKRVGLLFTEFIGVSVCVYVYWEHRIYATYKWNSRDQIIVKTPNTYNKRQKGFFFAFPSRKMCCF